MAVRLDDYQSSNKGCETRSWSPVCSRKLFWLPSWPTCQVPMLPYECTHSSGTGGWYQCHFLFSSSSTTRPESTSSETTPQATGSRRRPTTKEHASPNTQAHSSARSSSSRTTLVFNAYIMRDKEFQDLRREMEFYRHELEKHTAKNQSHEMTIKYLRKQLLKKDRQVDAQKKAVTFLRGQSS